MKELTELTGDTEVTSWIPADFYADLILEASVCYGQLDEICAIDYDAAQGTGGIVQVRYAPARTAQGPLAACVCLSATSTTLGTYSITIRPYGDYDVMCGYSLWKAKGPVKDVILNEMAKGLASARDTNIWLSIAGGAGHGFTPGVISYLSTHCLNQANKTTSCCEYKVNLYNMIVSAAKALEDACHHPDYVVMNPSVARWLYWANTAVPPGMLVKYTDDGRLLSVAGLKVVETGLATSCNSTALATMAVVLDSSRAVGQAWGKRPTFEETRVIECDYYKEVIWMYWGVHELDTTAIAHIRNPN